MGGLILVIATALGSAGPAAASAPHPDYPFALVDRQATTRALVDSADFDGDGNLDLLLAGATDPATGSAGPASIAFGEGGGEFAKVARRGPAGASAVLVEDFDGDGVPDLATAGKSGSEIRIEVSLGLGDGRFGGVATASLPASPGGTAGFHPSIRSGDFDGDGDPDIAVRGAGSVVTLPWQDGALMPAVETAVSFADPDRRPSWRLLRNGLFASGDFNGDGRDDVVVEPAVEGTGENELATLLGNADGSFTQVTTPLGPGASDGARAADLDGDGVLDLVLSSSDLAGGHANLITRYGLGDGAFDPEPAYLASPIGYEPPALADFDGDGTTDVASVTGYGEVHAFAAAGGRDFGGALPEGVAVAAPSGTAVAADLNADGWQDLAFTRGGRLEVQLNRLARGLELKPFRLDVEVAEPALPGSVSKLDEDLQVGGSCELACTVRIELRAPRAVRRRAGLTAAALGGANASWVPDAVTETDVPLDSKALRRLRHLNGRSLRLRLVIRAVALERTSDGRRRGSERSIYVLDSGRRR